MAEKKLHQIGVGLLGSVDAGKSSLLGALLTGERDDGNGRLRAKVARHPHEVHTGKTSDVTYHTCTFGENQVTLVDLAGHEKYLKTTIHGLSTFTPDLVLLCIDKYTDTYRMTREHLGLALRMKIPFAVLLTKTDLYGGEIHQTSLERFTRLVRKHSSRTLVDFDRDDLPLETLATQMAGLAVVPVFRISSVTRDGFDRLARFLARVQPREKIVRPHRFIVDRDYRVRGIGLVVCGYNGGPPLSTGTKVWLNGSTEATVWSIHDDYRNRQSTLPTGERGCLALRCRWPRVKTGTVISEEPISLVESITAEVEILTSHSTTISHGYQTLIHCGAVRRPASVISQEDQIFRGGSKGILTFRFQWPAYVEVGQQIFFREGRVIGDGIIQQVRGTQAS